MMFTDIYTGIIYYRTATIIKMIFTQLQYMERETRMNKQARLLNSLQIKCSVWCSQIKVTVE